jgi:probable HAF family extracellular repeat protein
LNNRGEIVGASLTRTGDVHAAVWTERKLARQRR